MPKLMTVCPTTGRDVPTQLTLDPLTFSIIKVPEFTLDCPLCGGSHRWSGEAAFFADEGREARPSAN